MSARSIGTRVVCGDCGKELTGQAALTGRLRFHVRKHNRPDGLGCQGHWHTAHLPTAAAIANHQRGDLPITLEDPDA